MTQVVVVVYIIQTIMTSYCYKDITFTSTDNKWKCPCGSIMAKTSISKHIISFSHITNYKKEAPVVKETKIITKEPEILTKEPVLITDISKLTKDELEYDITAFVNKQGKYFNRNLSNLKKPILIGLYNELKVDKHYTKQDKEQIKKDNETIDNYERLIERYIDATDNKTIKFVRSITEKTKTELEEIVKEYEMDKYDFKPYEDKCRELSMKNDIQKKLWNMIEMYKEGEKIYIDNTNKSIEELEEIVKKYDMDKYDFRKVICNRVMKNVSGYSHINRMINQLNCEPIREINLEDIKITDNQYTVKAGGITFMGNLY